MNDLPITTFGRRTPNLSRMHRCPTQQIVTARDSVELGWLIEWVEPTAPALDGFPSRRRIACHLVSIASSRGSRIGFGSAESGNAEPPRMVVSSMAPSARDEARERSTCLSSRLRSIHDSLPLSSGSGRAATTSPTFTPASTADFAPSPAKNATAEAPTSDVRIPAETSTHRHRSACSASVRPLAGATGVPASARTRCTCRTWRSAPEPCSPRSGRWSGSRRCSAARSRRALRSPARWRSGSPASALRSGRPAPSAWWCVLSTPRACCTPSASGVWCRPQFPRPSTLATSPSAEPVSRLRSLAPPDRAADPMSERKV